MPIRDLKHFYVLIKNDVVVTYATNYKAFYREILQIQELKGEVKSERTLNRYFKRNKIIIILGSDKKIYTLQKVI